MSQTAKDSTPETYHPDYTRNLVAWQLVEDCCEGGKKIKESTTLYLPKLVDQDAQEYAAYLKRAVFFGATGRTREALAGMVMRKQPMIRIPGMAETGTRAALDDAAGGSDNQALLGDVTMQGETILDWIHKVLDCSVSTGRSGTLIDWNEEEERPYLSHYKAVDVLNWAVERKDGRERLCFLAVREIDESLEDFVVDEVGVIRRYWIDQADDMVHFDVWRENPGSKESSFTQTTPDTPLQRRGKGVPMIPFVFHNAAHLGAEVGLIPLYDISQLNISHYQLTADLKNALHIAGQPTPWATGVTADEAGDLYLGTTKCWTIADPQAKVGFLEYTGAGIEPLAADINNTERQMATLGARLLFDQKKDAEAFETVQLRASSETAALVKIAAHQAATLTEALQWLYWWEGTEDDRRDVDAAIVLHNDFSTAQMQPTMLTALTSALQSNSISFDLFFYNLQKGELVPEGHDLEAEMAAIKQRPVMTPPAPAGPPGQPPKKEPEDPEDDPDDE